MWLTGLLIMVQCAFMTCGQVLLKIALNKMGTFSLTKQFFVDQLTNWWFLGCGICFGIGTVLWMYVLKKCPLSVALPLASVTYVFALLAAIWVFHEQVPLMRWAGVALIMIGCVLVLK